MTAQERIASVEQTPTSAVIALIPAHNEERFIASVVLKARRHVALVIVVDDGSTDGTAWLAEATGALVIRQPSNQGKAAALNVGLKAARERGAEAVILIDGDGQHNPDDIPAMLAPVLSGEADMVVGSRFMGAASGTPGWRVVGQQALTAATNLASGVALTDSQSGFRALSRRALESLSFRTQGFSVESEMQFLVKQHKLKTREVPIVVNYDEGPKRSPVQHGVQVVRGIVSMVLQHRPLVFFGVPGVLAVLAGLYMGFGVVQSYSTYPALAVGTALIAITLCILGVFTLFTGIILYAIRLYLSGR